MIVFKKIYHVGVGFRSLTEMIDTALPCGCIWVKLYNYPSYILSARNCENAHNGLDTARWQGRVSGRCPKLKTRQQHTIL